MSTRVHALYHNVARCPGLYAHFLFEPWLNMLAAEYPGTQGMTLTDELRRGTVGAAGINPHVAVQGHTDAVDAAVAFLHMAGSSVSASTPLSLANDPKVRALRKRTPVKALGAPACWTCG